MKLKNKKALSAGLLILLGLFLPRYLETSRIEEAEKAISTDIHIVKTAEASYEKTIDELIIEYFPNDVKLWRSVIWCESRNNPKADNFYSTADGLAQIIDSTWANFKCTGDKKSAEDNLRCASRIFELEGVKHWNASALCWLAKSQS